MATETVTPETLRDVAHGEVDRLRRVAAILNAGGLAARNETSAPRIELAELAALIEMAREEVCATVDALEPHI